MIEILIGSLGELSRRESIGRGNVAEIGGGNC